MRAGLPQKEPEILARWEEIDLYGKLREAAGPAEIRAARRPALRQRQHPYRPRAQQDPQGPRRRARSRCSARIPTYVPGWDCHGLPIEWKIEEDNYRAKGKQKPTSDPAAMIAFRQECRAYAEHWVDVQREEFKRLGVDGDWENPYSTMAYPAEAQIAREIMKFADERPALSRLEAGDVERRSKRPRSPRRRSNTRTIRQRYGVGGVS